MNLSPYLLFIIASGIIASFAQVLLKKSANIQYKSVIREYVNPYVIIGYGMMVLGMLLTVLAYKHVEYKNGPVLESFGFIYVTILSYFFFSEKITKKKILGNLIIILGVIVFYFA